MLGAATDLVVRWLCPLFLTRFKGMICGLEKSYRDLLRNRPSQALPMFSFTVPQRHIVCKRDTMHVYLYNGLDPFLSVDRTGASGRAVTGAAATITMAASLTIMQRP